MAIATGGDDQALHVLIVSLDIPRAGQGALARIVSSRLLQNAHSSALKVGALKECFREASVHSVFDDAVIDMVLADPTF